MSSNFGNYCMVRAIDSAGRIVIPKETRSLLDWDTSDPIFIGVKDRTVFMRKFTNICPICRNPYEDEKELCVCGECASKIISRFSA